MRKSICGFEGLYEVSDTGEVYSLRKNIILKQCLRNGYNRVRLWKNNKRYNRVVHRLVATAFIDNLEDYSDVDHINEVKTDNSVENLRWCSSAENVRYYHSDKKRPWSNESREIWINDQMYPSISSASGFIATEEGKNKNSINREMRRFLDSDRTSWTAYGKYVITKL